MLLRLGAILVLVVAILAFPWWLNFILFLLFIFIFRNFYEAAFCVLLFDILRYQPEATWPSLLLTISVIIVVYLSEMLKQRIVFYR